jgi:hypothetical protein
MDREQQAVVSVMFWGYITYNGVGTLTFIDGSMNSKYELDVKLKL